MTEKFSNWLASQSYVLPSDPTELPKFLREIANDLESKPQKCIEILDDESHGNATDLMRILWFLDQDDEGMQQQGAELLFACDSPDIWNSLMLYADLFHKWKNTVGPETRKNTWEKYVDIPTASHKLLSCPAVFSQALFRNPYYDYSEVRRIHLKTPLRIRDISHIKSLELLSVEILKQNKDSGSSAAIHSIYTGTTLDNQSTFSPEGAGDLPNLKELNLILKGKLTYDEDWRHFSELEVLRVSGGSFPMSLLNLLPSLKEFHSERSQLDTSGYHGGHKLIISHSGRIDEELTSLEIDRLKLYSCNTGVDDTIDLEIINKKNIKEILIVGSSNNNSVFLQNLIEATRFKPRIEISDNFVAKTIIGNPTREYYPGKHELQTIQTEDGKFKDEHLISSYFKRTRHRMKVKHLCSENRVCEWTELFIDKTTDNQLKLDFLPKSVKCLTVAFKYNWGEYAIKGLENLPNLTELFLSNVNINLSDSHLITPSLRELYLADCRMNQAIDEVFPNAEFNAEEQTYRIGKLCIHIVSGEIHSPSDVLRLKKDDGETELLLQELREAEARGLEASDLPLFEHAVELFSSKQVDTTPYLRNALRLSRQTDRGTISDRTTRYINNLAWQLLVPEPREANQLFQELKKYWWSRQDWKTYWVNLGIALSNPQGPKFSAAYKAKFELEQLLGSSHKRVQEAQSRIDLRK